MPSTAVPGLRASLSRAVPRYGAAATLLTRRHGCAAAVGLPGVRIFAVPAVEKKRSPELTSQFFPSLSALAQTDFARGETTLSGGDNAARLKISSAVLESDRKSDDAETLVELAEPHSPTRLPRKFSMSAKTGAFQHLPMVSPAYEILGSAIRRAKLVRATKGIMNAAKRERNQGAKQLDALMKELALPLKTYVQKFPQKRRLHAYESALLELTLGEGEYEEVLERVDLLRIRVLNTGKDYASKCAKSTTKLEAKEWVTEGFARLEGIFEKYGNAVDDLKGQAMKLRLMPTISLRTPTLCLVGAPNVGKSSLVRVLSSGKPEINNYEFTTRGISLGHFTVGSRRFQVTDTPGLLERTDEKRNKMEKMTLAALSHLPTSVLFVHDLTGQCGSPVSKQFNIYQEMRRRYADRPWLDVVSKADLLPVPPSHNTSAKIDSVESYAQFGPTGALRVSVQSGEGVEQLVQQVHALLALAYPDESKDEDSTHGEAASDFRSKPVQEFYYPAWPRKQEN